MGENPGERAPRPLAALREATRRTIADWKGHAVYGILAAAAGALLLFPAGSWILVQAMRIGEGRPVVNTEITSFVFSVRGLLMFALWSSLVGLVVVVAAAGHAHLASSALGQHPTVRAVLRMVGADLLRVPGRGGAKLALLGALGLPVLAAAVGAVTSLLLVPVHGLAALRNVVPRGLPLPPWMVGTGMAVLAVAFAWLYVRWSLAIPALALEGVSLTEGIRRSVRRVRGAFWRIGAPHLVHHVTVAVVAALLVFLFRLGARPLLIALFERSEEAGTIGMAALLAVFSGFAGLLGILATARLISLTVVHHAALGGALERPGAAPPAPSRRLRLGGVLLAIGAIVAFATALWVTLPRVRAELERATHPTRVSAHRGGSLEAPENTLAAVRNAIEARADWVEFDVQQAKDGTLVVVHDPELTRLAGVAAKVGQLTWEELSKLDVGSHFSPAFRGERISTLEQVIDAAGDRIALEIELKTNGHETAAFVPDVIALLERKGLANRCLVMSLEAKFVREIRRLRPGIRLGVIITAKVGTASDLDVDYYAVQPLLATSDFIRRAHAEGRDVHVWVVDDEEDMGRLADRAVDSLITDRPRLARKVLDARTAADGVRAAARRLFGVD